MLRRLVAQHGTKKWAYLATIIKSKKSKQVGSDTMLRSVTTHLSNKGATVQNHSRSMQTDASPGNVFVQCRRRWKNFQDAELKKTGVWSPKVTYQLLKK